MGDRVTIPMRHEILALKQGTRYISHVERFSSDSDRKLPSEVNGLSDDIQTFFFSLSASGFYSVLLGSISFHFLARLAMEHLKPIHSPITLICTLKTLTCKHE